MAKYQSMLVVIDPNQDDQPALRRAVYLHQRIGGRIKAFLPIYDFSYEMTTLLSPDERTAMRQGVIAQRTAWIREQAKFYIESGVPIDVKVVWHNRPFEAIIQEVISEKHDLLLKMAHQHDKLEAVIFTPPTGICCVSALPGVDGKRPAVAGRRQSAGRGQSRQRRELSQHPERKAGSRNAVAGGRSQPYRSASHRRLPGDPDQYRD
jgi:hypothetical protein